MYQREYSQIIAENTNVYPVLIKREKPFFNIKIEKTLSGTSAGISDTSNIFPKLWELLLEVPLEEEKMPILPKRLTDPQYGSIELDEKLKKLAEKAPGIEKIWEITRNLPSFTDLLSEERDNDV